MAAKSKRNKFVKVDPSSIGLSVAYNYRPINTPTVADLIQEEREEQREKEARAARIPQTTPCAHCPICRGRWFVPDDSPIHQTGQYKLRPLECPNYNCYGPHLAKLSQEMSDAALEIKWSDSKASHEHYRKVQEAYRRAQEAGATARRLVPL